MLDTHALDRVVPGSIHIVKSGAARAVRGPLEIQKELFGLTIDDYLVNDRLASLDQTPKEILSSSHQPSHHLRPTEHADPLRDDLHGPLRLRCQHDRLEVGVQR